MQRKFLLRKIAISIVAIMVGAISFVAPKSFAITAPPHTNFCTAGNYVLLGSVITNGANTRITSTYPGAIVGGVSPAELLALVGSEAGVTNELDATAHINAMSSLGKVLDRTTALATAQGSLTAIELSGDHSGAFPLGTYGPGVYKTFAAMNIAASSVITLDAVGDPNANFYFIAGNALTIGAGVRINLANGAQASNVYWVAGSFTGDLTLGATTVLYGNFLVRGAATLGGGSQIFGRLLATGAITIGAGAHIYGIAPDTACTTPGATTPGTTTPGTTTPGATTPGTTTPGTTTPGTTTPGTTTPGTTTPGTTTPGTTTPGTTTPGTTTPGTTTPGTTTPGTTTPGTTTPGTTTPGTTTPGTTTPTVIPIVITQIVPPPVAQTITFTDTTLVDGQASLYYSDYLFAKTLYGGIFSGQSISYALYGNLPAGISFANSTGVLSGLISRDTIPGYYPLTVAAFSNGYATEVLNLNWRVLAAPVVTVPTPTPTATAVTKTPVSVATLSILFTDTTLIKGIVGRTYTDYVQAKTFSGNTFTEEKVSYSLAGDLPTGLTFSTSTGYISGIISNGVIPGVYKVLVSAFSKGYPTQMYPYDFTVVSGTTIAVTASPAPSVTPSPIPSPTAPSKSTTNQLATMALMDTIWFDLGKSLLTTSAKASLNQMITKLVQSKYKSVVVNGFTDAVKGQPHPTLSLARANAVRSYILARTNGIMVSASGLGMAAGSSSSSSAMQESRKADIWVG